MSDFFDVARETGQARRRHRRRVALVTALAVLAALLAGGVTLWEAAHTCGFSGLTRSGISGECYGITDGAFIFDPRLAPVERLIAAENQDVTKSGQPYVTVAFYAPMTLGKGDTTSPDSTRHDLEGAYVAQMRANHTAAVGTAPKIRLVLANPGASARHWRPVVDQLAGLTDAPDRLVAVTGLGTSTDNTRATVDALSEKHIAMVGSVLTATDFDAHTYPGLVRVAPTNNDEAAALINYLPTGVHSALLVQDTNGNDNYVATLGSAFRSGFPASGQKRHMVGQVETYDSSLANAGDRFAQIADAACQQHPDIVFFAGRGIYLTDFLKALGHRHCRDPFTVLSGDDTTHVTFDAGNEVADALRGTGGRAPITMVYSALAHPDEWQDPALAGFNDFDDFLAQFRAHPEISGDPLDDGQAMMAHDAVLTAVTAIRGPLGQAATVPIPSAQEVVQNLAGLHLAGSVLGASGTISINGETGDPVDKPVPILRREADGTVTFVQLSWPQAHPPAKAG